MTIERRWFAVALLALLSSPLLAAECSTTIQGNDAMQFNKSSITVPASCAEFTVTLEHTGNLPRNVMGHNWVLTTTADMQAAAANGMQAGLDNNYVDPGDARILAHTRVIGGGESASVTFDVAPLRSGGPYSYFCSFPGHSALMKGTLKVQ